MQTATPTESAQTVEASPGSVELTTTESAQATAPRAEEIPRPTEQTAAPAEASQVEQAAAPSEPSQTVEPQAETTSSSIDEQIARAEQEARADIPRSDFDERMAQIDQEVNLSFETEREVEYPQAPPLVEDAAEVARNYQERMRQTLEAMNGGKPLSNAEVVNEAEATRALHEEISEGLERARQEGRLTEEQQRELMLNRERTERAMEFDEMGQAVVECSWHAEG